jgi:hypothetical protein
LLMAFRDKKIFKTNWATFFDFFHEPILSKGV